MRGYTCVFICRLYKTDFLTSYLPPWLPRLFKKGSTLKGKQKSRLVMIFFYELTPFEKGCENEVASLQSVPIQIKNSSIRPCNAKEM